MDKNERNERGWLSGTIRQGRSIAALLPIMAVVFVAYLVIGLAMPVLPLHVHQGLGLSTFVVGTRRRKPVRGDADLAGLGGPPGRYTGRKTCGRHWPFSRSRSRAPLSFVAAVCRHSGDVGRDPATGPRGARRGGELHRRGRTRLGARARRTEEYWHRPGADRNGNVRRLRGRRAGGHCALCLLRLCGDCTHDDVGSALHSVARRATSLCRAKASNSPCVRKRNRCRLGAGAWSGARKRRFSARSRRSSCCCLHNMAGTGLGSR